MNESLSSVSFQHHLADRKTDVLVDSILSRIDSAGKTPAVLQSSEHALSGP
jgi:hypothetical protein